MISTFARQLTATRPRSSERAVRAAVVQSFLHEKMPRQLLGQFGTSARRRGTSTSTATRAGAHTPLCILRRVLGTKPEATSDDRYMVREERFITDQEAQEWNFKACRV